MEALSELGPELTAERDFTDTSRRMLTAVMEAAGAREGALFVFHEKPTMLSSVVAEGFAMLPEPAFIPLLPKHVHALSAARGPIVLNASTYSVFLSSNGNVAPELFKCIAPLKSVGKLAGVIALGRRPGDAPYLEAELDATNLLCSYIGLAVHNHALTQTLAQRVTENLRLMASLHGFYDSALEAFATAIDVKHVNIHGHSLRVGRYAAAIGEAMGMDAGEVAALRSAGYLHDIGKVAVDRRLFSKASALNPEEFREMADHTVVGHQIVSSVEFPWPKIHESVRWHHERSDGSGYPDALSGDDLPMPVRIMALADTFDAMTSATSLPRAAVAGQRAQRSGAYGSAEIRSQRSAGAFDSGAPRCRGEQSNSAAGRPYGGEHLSHRYGPIGGNPAAQGFAGQNVLDLGRPLGPVCRILR